MQFEDRPQSSQHADTLKTPCICFPQSRRLVYKNCEYHTLSAKLNMHMDAQTAPKYPSQDGGECMYGPPEWNTKNCLICATFPYNCCLGIQRETRGSDEILLEMWITLLLSRWQTLWRQVIRCGLIHHTEVAFDVIQCWIVFNQHKAFLM